MNLANVVIIAGPSSWLAPDQEPPGQLLPEGTAPVGKSPRKNIITLLVEDNRPDVLMIEEAISLHGLPIELHVVDDGSKAFEFIDRAEGDPAAPCPQMLLLDLNLPKRSGREVLQRLRESAKCKDIPVLVITSSDSERDRKDVRELGANHYFCKPANYDDFLKLGEVLETLLEHRGI